MPIPEANLVNRSSNITAREIRVCLWSKLRGEFVGNTLTFGADWRSDYEDRWTFNSSNHGDSGQSNWKVYGSKSAKNSDFILRFTNLKPDDREIDNLQLIFEFVVYIVYKETELQMTCGWASADLSDMLKPTELNLQLNGGSPKADIKIKEEDVRTERKTFMGRMGKLFSKVSSNLRIKVKPTDKLGKKTLEDIDMLPKRGLFKVNSIKMMTAFRCYLGKNIIKSCI